MEVLWLVTTFPEPRYPVRGVFVQSEAQEVGRLCDLEVLQEVPGFPPLPRYALERRLLAALPAARREGSYRVHALRVPYVPPWRFPEDVVMAIGTVLGTVAAVRWLRRQRARPALIHAHMATTAFTGAVLARVSGVPLVTTVYGSDVNYGTQARPGKWLRRWRVLYALRASDAVIGVSEALCRKVRALGVAGPKAVHIPNGFDEAKFRPTDPGQARQALGLPPSKNIVLYVGNFVPVKGADVLIEAFGRLGRCADDVALYCVGDGSERGHLERRVQELGMDGRVFFVGRRPHAEIPLWMNACDVFALASRNEGWPTVLSEVMACGKPVVATAVGGVPEIVRHGFLGEVVEPEAPEALAQALQRILARPADGQAIREYAEQFRWSAIAARVVSVYRSVTAGAS